MKRGTPRQDSRHRWDSCVEDVGSDLSESSQDC